MLISEIAVCILGGFMPYLIVLLDLICFENSRTANYYFVPDLIRRVADMSCNVVFIYFISLLLLLLLFICLEGECRVGDGALHKHEQLSLILRM